MSQFLMLFYPVLLAAIPGAIVISTTLLGQQMITAEHIALIFGMVTILGSILVVYVRNETRAAIQAVQIEDIRKRLGNGDTQLDGLKRSVDGLRLTMERLITLEEARGLTRRVKQRTRSTELSTMDIAEDNDTEDDAI